jgi:hypothetical protein
LQKLRAVRQESLRRLDFTRIERRRRRRETVISRNSQMLKSVTKTRFFVARKLGGDSFLPAFSSDFY